MKTTTLFALVAAAAMGYAAEAGEEGGVAAPSYNQGSDPHPHPHEYSGPPVYVAPPSYGKYTSNANLPACQST